MPAQPRAEGGVKSAADILTSPMGGDVGEVSIRRARASDLDVMMELWFELEAVQGPFRIFPLRDAAPERMRAQFEEAIEHPDAAALIAEDDDGVAGMAVAWFEERKESMDEIAVVDIGRMVVRADRRGKGVGSALVTAAERFGRQRGARYLSMATFAGNDAARGFWIRQGFQLRYESRVRPI